jgi:hypothetical protein
LVNCDHGIGKSDTNERQGEGEIKVTLRFGEDVELPQMQ